MNFESKDVTQNSDNKDILHEVLMTIRDKYSFTFSDEQLYIPYCAKCRNERFSSLILFEMLIDNDICNKFT